MVVQRGTISITRMDTGETRTFPADTSFEPYRREAFRRRTIESQRESIDLTNIPGEGTLATEGTWRREQVDWSYGAGQFSLDRKGDDDPRRFYSSQGVDIFNYPQRLTLLPQTQSLIGDTYVGQEIFVTFCNDLWVVGIASTGDIKVYTPGSNPGSPTWGGPAGMSYDDSGTTPSAMYSMCANATVVYVATNTGIWYSDTVEGSGFFSLYAANDTFEGFTNYNLVRWANDQLIAAAGPRLYAFQPRGGSGEAPFGSPPSSISPNSINANIVNIENGYPSGPGTSATVNTSVAHGLVPGQYIAISGTTGRGYISTPPTLSGGVLTITTNNPHGFVVGEELLFLHVFVNGVMRTETCPVESVTSDTVFTYQTNVIGADILAVGYDHGTARATGDVTGNGYNNPFNVDTVPTDYSFTIDVDASQYGGVSLGGAVVDPTQNGSYLPDALVTMQDPSWVWSDATGGQTQVYYGGYSNSGGIPKNGGIFRSDLLGSSTSSSDGIQTIASASVAQPWMLDTPVQCLPMSPDEYPVCVRAYLNYIFVGTNRGIRMCQTLSIYDPTATATGDLKSGSIIPNILQPVKYPVNGLVGDGRFVWFSWSGINGAVSGLGKLDLTTFIPGDDLTPVYASDIYQSSPGEVGDVIWDPINNLPIFIYDGGIFGPCATNPYGQIVAYEYVASGSVTSSYFDFGIAEPKIPIYFDYGAWLPTDTEASASVVMDPLAPSPQTISVTPYTPGDGLIDNEFLILQSNSYPNDRGRMFQTTVTLTTTSSSVAPVLNRWTLKAWATPVQGTLISAVINAFRIATLDEGIESGLNDPESNYNWLEAIRYNGILLTYVDGQSSVLGVIDSIDDIPHKARGDFKAGFEGDFVVDIKTLGPWTYTPTATT